MLLLWMLLITSVTAQKVYDSTEDIGPEAFQNVTTLYPIAYNNTFSNSTSTPEQTNENQIADIDNTVGTNQTDCKEDKSKIDATVWKIEATFAESDLESENVTEADKTNDTKEFRPSPHLGNFYDEDSLQVIPPKASFESFTPMKKPSSGFVSASDGFHSSFTKIPKQIFETHKQYPYKFETPILTRSKRPWEPERPDSIESRPTMEIPVKVPAGGFYKFEDPFRTKAEFAANSHYDPFKQIPGYPGKDDDYSFSGKPEFSGNSYNDPFRKNPGFLENVNNDPFRDQGSANGYNGLFRGKPESFPGKGDNDPFRDKPGSNEEDFGLSFAEDGKEAATAVKKRVNPWENFLRLVTAFLPVGLIISALTPSIVTIENTGQAGPGGPGQPYPSNLFRRSETISDPPRISERCRRRLLCEIHSDKNYNNDKSSVRRGKQCYKIHCEDTEAVARTLRWLLEYRRSQNAHYT